MTGKKEEAEEEERFVTDNERGRGGESKSGDVGGAGVGTRVTAFIVDGGRGVVVEVLRRNEEETGGEEGGGGDGASLHFHLGGNTEGGTTSGTENGSPVLTVDLFFSNVPSMDAANCVSVGVLEREGIAFGHDDAVGAKGVGRTFLADTQEELSFSTVRRTDAAELSFAMCSREVWGLATVSSSVVGGCGDGKGEVGNLSFS